MGDPSPAAAQEETPDVVAFARSMSAVPSVAARSLAALPVLRSRRVRTIGRQVGVGLLTLFVISVVTFGMMSVRSADQIAREKFGNQVTTEQVQAFSHEFGLDKPIYERYGKWLWHFVQGDMGTSYVTNSPVA